MHLEDIQEENGDTDYVEEIHDKDKRSPSSLVKSVRQLQVHQRPNLSKLPQRILNDKSRKKGKGSLESGQPVLKKAGGLNSQKNCFS